MYRGKALEGAEQRITKEGWEQKARSVELLTVVKVVVDLRRRAIALQPGLAGVGEVVRLAVKDPRRVGLRVLHNAIRVVQHDAIGMVTQNARATHLGRAGAALDVEAVDRDAVLHVEEQLWRAPAQP